MILSTETFCKMFCLTPKANTQHRIFSFKRSYHLLEWFDKLRLMDKIEKQKGDI